MPPPSPRPGTASAAAASQHGADDLGELRKRVAALEARIAELESKLAAPEAVAEVLKEIAALEARGKAGFERRCIARSAGAWIAWPKACWPIAAIPFIARSTTPPAVWRKAIRGCSTTAPTHRAARKRGARAVLVVPSLINRWEVLDLTAEKSLLRAMAAEGLRPYLVDWGTPDAEERRFDLTAYVARLERALAFVAKRARRAPAVMGYCMGGTLARGARRAPAAPGGEARAARRPVGLPCRQDRPRLPALDRAVAGASWPTGWASCRSMCCRRCSGRSIPGSR